MIADDEMRLLRKIGHPEVGLGLGLANGGRARGLSSTVRIGLFADSRGVGRGAGTGTNNMVGARPLSYLAKAKTYLAMAGYSASDDSWFGNAANTGGTLPSYDPRIVLGSYVESTVGGVLGGFGLSATAGTNLTFTPTGQFDTYRVYHPEDPTINSLMPVYVDVPASAVDINENGSVPILRINDYTTNLANHYVGVGRRTSPGGTVYLHGMECFNSAANEFRLLNFSARGWATSDFSTSDKPWRPLLAIDTVKVDVGIVALGGNDTINGVSLATYKMNMGTIIERIKAAKSGARVLLYLDPPINPSQEVGFTQAQMRTANYELASEHSCDILDSWTATGTWSEMVAAGETVDATHLTAAPYARMGNQLASKLRQIAGVP